MKCVVHIELLSEEKCPFNFGFGCMKREMTFLTYIHESFIKRTTFCYSSCFFLFFKKYQQYSDKIDKSSSRKENESNKKGKKETFQITRWQIFINLFVFLHRFVLNFFCSLSLTVIFIIIVCPSLFCCFFFCKCNNNNTQSRVKLFLIITFICNFTYIHTFIHIKRGIKKI